MYHLRVTVTFTTDLVFRIIESGAYLLYNLRKESKKCVWRISFIFIELGVQNLV